MVDTNQTPPSGEDTPNQVTETPSEEDIAERSKASGVQARIDELTKEKYELAAQLKTMQEKQVELEKRMAPPTPANPTSEKAVEYLKSLGFTQAKDVQAEIQAVKDRMALDNEHMKLSGEYDGSDGRPAYNQKKIEEYMRIQGIYNPEVAYKAMHEAELLDWSMKKANISDKKPFIEKPGSSISNREDDTITREKLDEWMKSPEGRMKYEQNRTKILQLMVEGKL